MDTRAILADNMKAYRKRAGLTQMQLSEAAGLHRAYIGRIEQRRLNVSLEVLDKVATALDIEPYQLLLPENKQS